MAATTMVKFLLLAGVLQMLVPAVQCEEWLPILPTLCHPHHVPQLHINTARLSMGSDDQTNMMLVLYMQSSECYECDLEAVMITAANCSVLVDTRWPVKLEIRIFNGTQLFTTSSCSAANNTQLFREGGEYIIYTQQTEESDDILKCSIAPINSPPDAKIPIYVALGIAGILPVLWMILKSLYRRGLFHRMLCIWSSEHVMSDLGRPIIVNPTDDTVGSSHSTPDTTSRQSKERVKSLDTFRGLSIVVMIFVNYQGGRYWFFQHSKWNGLTMADLVFPWFVFIMGTAMILSFQGQLQHGVSKWSMLGKIVRRSITLFALGLVINSLGGPGRGVDVSQFRIPGVLQRFALTYLVVATVHLVFAKPLDQNQVRWSAVRDIVDFWPEWIVQLSLVAVHIGITFGLHVPGCPRGYLGAGGMAEQGRHLNCTGGAAGYIDRQVFGRSHLDQHPSCLEIYQTVVPYDPEGLLGTLTSIFLCFLGLQAGKILFIHKSWLQRFVRFLLWGVVLCLIAGVLCKFSKDDGWIPINKNLWSLSFVLALSGMAFLLLSVFYLLIDVFKVWNGAPFLYPGMNPIVLYMGHELLKGRFPVEFDVPSTHGAQLAMNLWGTVFWVLVGYYLHYKAIFITV
ncbi:heparan-alpha-glucosaminide N-acetyltransferase-like isoform X2 [Babylonia areolata]|uniref:heparan-alpha-glucosaminide N-acetyltransferase-like isoform X2 n=1 Tax=Babylonia areolata TaxID=304850 RepID=UPI003FCF6DCB